MKTIKLIRLTLENFKGVEGFTLDAQGENIMVSGTNGLGKTTLFDAYTWLLFGKDSAGRSDSAFDVKPYGAQTPTVSVCAVFDLGEDGTITLKRQLSEKIVRQKGTDEVSIKNDYSFYVDDVPKTKTQYDANIEAICPVETWMMVSDPDRFAGKMRWQDRRRILSELFGGMDEKCLLVGDEWAELAAAAEGRTIADFQKMISAERKRIRAELDALPGRIDEAQKAIPESTGSYDPDELSAAEIAVSEAESAMRAASDGTLTIELTRQIAEAKARLAEASAKHYSRFGNSELLGDISLLEYEKAQAESSISDLERRITNAEAMRVRYEDSLKKLRDEYREINAESFDKDTELCPCCHRRLPEDDIERLRAEFNLARASRLEQNIADGKRNKAALDEMETALREYRAEAEKLRAVLGAKCTELEAAKARVIEPPTFESTYEYAELSAEVDALEYQLASSKQNVSGRTAEYAGALERARQRLAELRAKEAAKALAERQTARVEQLMADGRRLGKRAAQLDRLLDLASRFEQYKLTAIEDNVNARFRYARFKLFDRQLNGGYAECCEVTVDDAPYSTNLNPGKKINAGLDIIHTLSSAVGFSAPVWIDNCESYVKLNYVGAQIIRLRVDGSAEALTVSHEE